jgi:hypothetical protein
MAGFRYVVIESAGAFDLRTAPDPARTKLASETHARLAALQAAVGGYIEQLTLTAAPVPGLLAFLNEDGHALNLPGNITAAMMLHALGVRLVYPIILGPLVFTGSTTDDVAGLTDAQLHLVRSVHGECYLS